LVCLWAVLAPATAAPAADRPPCANHNPLRNVYFGDLHVHTKNSFDAHIFDVRNTPEDAYRFAKGAALTLPPLDATGQGTRTIRIDRPLDFVAVTDHSELLGEVEGCSTPGSESYDAPSCQDFRKETSNGDPYPAVRKFGVLFTPKVPKRLEDICGTDNQYCLSLAADVWQRIVNAAEGSYDRTAACSFTSFIAYEYSASPGASTLHRNVIFRNEYVPFPTSVFEQPTPQGLWRELKHTCLDAGTGCDVLAIPHNSNESNGNMFYVEYPGATTPAAQREQAAFRAAMEPLFEIFQHKGDGECMNGLSGILGAPDEQCEFEKRPRAVLADCGDGRGNFGAGGQGCFSRLDFARGVLLAGLKEYQRLGVNPYQFGIIASTDTHNGTPGAVAEDAFMGHRGTDDDVPERLLGTGELTPGGMIFNPGGLAAVWAEENSRDAIFDALRRRETFGTSGPRMTVRFFGSWEYPADVCAAPNLAQIGYGNGVPMGGVLPLRPSRAATPTFVIAAQGDPGTAERPGSPLQRLQVIKVWIENGESHQQVFDVAGDPNNGATVDVQTCVPSGLGATSLCTVWTDPDFKPHQQAAYYGRVLENPSCRWSTIACNRLAPAERPATCDDPQYPKTVQERAWTSPIWYAPAVTACGGDCGGDGEVTVNELVVMVNVALGSAPVSQCAAGDANGDGDITVNEIILGVNHTLDGCPS